MNIKRSQLVTKGYLPRIILIFLYLLFVGCAKPSAKEVSYDEAVPMPGPSTKPTCTYYSSGYHTFCNGSPSGQADSYDCGTTNTGLSCWRYVSTTSSEWRCVPVNESGPGDCQ